MLRLKGKDNKVDFQVSSQDSFKDCLDVTNVFCSVGWNSFDAVSWGVVILKLLAWYTLLNKGCYITGFFFQEKPQQ